MITIDITNLRTLEIDNEIRTGVHVIIDYFSATFPFIIHSDDYELLIVEDIVNLVSSFLGFKKEDIEKETYSQNRYKYQYTIAEAITLRLIGPALKSGYSSCMIELKGEGCRVWENNNLDKSWIDFLEFFLIRLNSSPTRLDLTIDDYEGKYFDFNWLKRKLDNRCYQSIMQEKKYTIHGNDIDGFTLQFGSNTSVYELVIYEKLKEQLKKGISTMQTYWLRFEMRFRQNRAYDVAMNIINLKNEDEFRHFTMTRLLEILDIKVDNKYNAHNIGKAKTDENWLSFLEEVKKAKMKRYKVHKSTYETYLNYIKPKMASFIVNLLLQNGNDIYITTTKLLEIALYDFERMDERKMKRYNEYLKELGIKQIELEELEYLRFKLEQEIQKRNSLPF